MAKGVINLQKESGGIVKISPADGTGVTEVIVPENGELATKDYVDNLKTIASGTATFTATTNNINLTGIGIGVEIGDVIQISGAEDAKNNSEFTVEVIIDNNNIIVNQAHANKGTTKNVANRASDAGVTVKLLSKYYNAPLGLGQDWVDVNPNRSLNTNYQNLTNRYIDIYSHSSAPLSGLNACYIHVPEIAGTVGISTYSPSGTSEAEVRITIKPNGIYKYTAMSYKSYIFERR